MRAVLASAGSGINKYGQLSVKVTWCVCRLFFGETARWSKSNSNFEPTKFAIENGFLAIICLWKLQGPKLWKRIRDLEEKRKFNQAKMMAMTTMFLEISR